MEFWGVEVKAGEPLKVQPEEGLVVHISQAALGEGKKGNEIVPLRLKINDKMFVVGSLSGEKFPQVSFDLVLEKEFELSHDWKNGSVYFLGYTAENPYDSDEEGFDEESSDEELPVGISGNGAIGNKVAAQALELAPSKAKAAKPDSSAKPKVTIAEPQKDDDSDEDEDDSDDDEDDSDDDEDLMDDSEDEDDLEDEDSEDEDEDTPKKDGSSKKRQTESATKTPPAKKMKLGTPLKTDGKKGGVHTATPHPSKKTGKSPAANSNKGKEQTPKSEGKVSCKTCNRAFNSDKALESHSKAKHGSS